MVRAREELVGRLGSLYVFSGRLGSMKISRNAEIRGNPLRSCVMVLRIREGTMRGCTAGRIVHLGKGDLCCFDLAQTTDFHLRECSLTALFVPSKSLRGKFHARPLRDSQLLCRLLSAHLDELIAAPLARGAKGDATARASISILQLCLDFSSEPTPTEQDKDPRLTITAYIDEHLDEADLKPARLCQVFNVSRTWLYEAFSSYGGITRYIREKRLDAAFRDLCEKPRVRIIDVAYRHGFPSERQFQRAFLGRFGVQPSAVRDRRNVYAEIEAG